MDPENPIVKLCVAGMQAEFEGRLEDARTLFAQAWDEHRDSFEGCIAAHYLARHQDDPQQSLYWNELSLKYAQDVEDERVLEFFPSLYLNMGYAYEALANLEEAARYYELAAAKVEDLPDGSYGDVVREAILRGQQRISRQANHG